MGCEERVERDGLSFDSEEGVAGGEDQIAGKEEETTIIVVNRRAKNAAVAARDGDGYDGGSDPFAVAHAATELTMGAARDEEKGVVNNVRRAVGILLCVLLEETLCFYRET
ncbi:hypothetical protein B296_00003872 [Ensete ventricosum]|uniref:Uncharacterized protein n=1 Tax=Ensete ventricosum TaxID=4639 RepID=A0A427B9X2_ENSVE|nr:hypothetical protein B296_00003872 [Ensete ventricosum]